MTTPPPERHNAYYSQDVSTVNGPVNYQQGDNRIDLLPGFSEWSIWAMVIRCLFINSWGRNKRQSDMLRREVGKGAVWWEGRMESGRYLSELISHEEGRGICFRLHVSHMGCSGGVNMVGRKHLWWNQKNRASYLLRNENQSNCSHTCVIFPQTRNIDDTQLSVMKRNTWQIETLNRKPCHSKPNNNPPLAIMSVFRQSRALLFQVQHLPSQPSALGCCLCRSTWYPLQSPSELCGRPGQMRWWAPCSWQGLGYGCAAEGQVRCVVWFLESVEETSLRTRTCLKEDRRKYYFKQMFDRNKNQSKEICLFHLNRNIKSSRVSPWLTEYIFTICQINTI